MPPRRGSCGLVVDDQFVVGCFFFFPPALSLLFLCRRSECLVFSMSFTVFVVVEWRHFVCCVGFYSGGLLSTG